MGAMPQSCNLCPTNQADSPVKNHLKALPGILIIFISTSLAANEQLLDLEIKPDTGQVFLHFDSLPAEFLYVPALQSGVGSNDIGLDRGQLDRTRLVRFERYGNRVLLVEPNLKFRADTADTAEQRAVNQAFAQSVLAGFEITSPQDAQVTIDITPLLVSDITRISTLVSELEQGSYEIDATRSSVDTASIRNFPLNTLIPAVITFKGSKPGQFIRDVTPTPDSLTVRVMHQFVQLPDDGYRPRAFHPRSGYFELAYRDYAAPLGDSMERRLIYRHRLNPGTTLVYYVDNGTPEPIRSALLEGASWWADAFAEAGYPGLFKVEVLPEGADPLDARYNVIQWVHRATRGWSYGFSISDPRTGEIIKGHVSLGSLRVRQDQMIAEALTAPFGAQGDQGKAAQGMALARLRQLAAHEVGHTLGIDHNFAASYSGDASVMDYPHPNFYLDENGRVRLDRAYQAGVSPWDKLAVRYGYSEFSGVPEAQGLAAILAEAEDAKIAFITDQDARNPGAAHPAANLWDNGNDAIARLDELLEIREVALRQFSEDVIPQGAALFELESRLVPVYLLHRYQVEAVAKLLAGQQYDYRLRGDIPSAVQPVPAATQQLAVRKLLGLLDAPLLALPESVRYLVPPPPLAYARNRENFRGATATTFDHLAPARAAADLVLSELLQPQRLARMAEQHALDPDQPDPNRMLSDLVAQSWKAKPPADSYQAAIAVEVNWQVLRHLMELAGPVTPSDSTRALGLAQLVSLADDLESQAKRGNPQAAAAVHEINAFLEGKSTGLPELPPPAPPGSPIG
jgi:hypothetical protein